MDGKDVMPNRREKLLKLLKGTRTGEMKAN